MVEYILAVEQITNKNMTILEELLLLVVQVSDDTENFCHQILLQITVFVNKIYKTF